MNKAKENRNSIIVSKKGILGGEPCFSGTRIPLIFIMYQLYHYTIPKVLRDYPILKKHKKLLEKIDKFITFVIDKTVGYK